MWIENNRSTNPSEVKSNIAKLASQFSGYRQQDSQELMNFLLDGLHEDLNLVTEKPYSEIKEKSENESDSDAALRFWENHKSRNDSIIVDLFNGQYKSTIICPDCKRNNITFDPFVSVSLPIPSLLTTSIFFIPSNNVKKTIKLSISFSKRELIISIKDKIKEALKDHMIGYDGLEGKYLLVDDNKVIARPKETDSLLKLDRVGYIMFYELDKSLLQKQKEMESKVLTIPLNIIFNSNKDDNTYPRMIAFDENINDFNYNLYYFIRKYTDGGVLNTVIKKINELVHSNTLDSYDELIAKANPENINDYYNSIKEVIKIESVIMVNNKCNEKFYQDIQDCLSKLDKELLSSLNEYKQKFFGSFELFLNNDTDDIEDDNNDSSSKLFIDLSNNSDNSFNYGKIFDLINKKETSYNLYLNIKEINDIFTKMTISKIKTCSVLNNKTINKCVKLEDCLNEFEITEKLDKDNEWYCNKCKKHVRASMKLEIYKAPKILILHLKRFETSKVRFSQSTKIDIDVSLPIDHDFDMNNYICDKSKSNIYELYAISNHFGSTGGGHYTATAKNFGKWYNFNDSTVSSTSNVGGGSAYILMFKRKDN